MLIVFVEFHPFSEAGAFGGYMPPGLGYVHLVFLVEESPDLCPGLQAQKQAPNSKNSRKSARHLVGLK